MKRVGRPRKYSQSDLEEMKTYITENAGQPSNTQEVTDKIKLYRAVLWHRNKVEKPVEKPVDK
jgi:hypothetical protein